MLHKIRLYVLCLPLMTVCYTHAADVVAAPAVTENHTAALAAHTAALQQQNEYLKTIAANTTPARGSTMLTTEMMKGAAFSLGGLIVGSKIVLNLWDNFQRWLKNRNQDPVVKRGKLENRNILRHEQRLALLDRSHKQEKIIAADIKALEEALVKVAPDSPQYKELHAQLERKRTLHRNLHLHMLHVTAPLSLAA